MNSEINEMFIKAKEVALNNKYSKYSNYVVGAALKTSDGTIVTGTNIENHGIQSICAERCAFVKALSDGFNEFESILIIGKNINDKTFSKVTPCGYCREFMSEYANKNFKIYTYDENSDKLYEYTLNDLLPESFDF